MTNHNLENKVEKSESNLEYGNEFGILAKITGVAAVSGIAWGLANELYSLGDSDTISLICAGIGMAVSLYYQFKTNYWEDKPY